MEPFENHQVVGEVNQSTVSYNSIAQPVEKVKSGYNYIIRGEVKNMCEALDKLVEKGREEGREEGRVIAYADVGFSIDEIARKVGMTKEEVNNILQEQK